MARAWPMLMSPSQQQRAHVLGQVEQAQQVGDVAARLADQPADLVLVVPEADDQLLVGLGLLDRVEVGALDILDQRDFGGRGVVELADERRDAVELRLLRRAPAALAGDDLDSRRRPGGAGSAGARPCRRSTAASSSSATSSKCLRGWCGIGADLRELDLAHAAALDASASLGARGARTASSSSDDSPRPRPVAFFMPPPPRPAAAGARSFPWRAGHRLPSRGI